MKIQKMTIHRGLAELKLIDSRIEKSIILIEPTGMMQTDKLVNGLYKKEDFEKDVKSKMQSINDLIERKNKIKSAIVKINGITEVKINEKTMTIADAINFKNVIKFKKLLIESLEKKHTSVKAKFTRENENVYNVALENAKIMLGRQTDDKATPDDKDVDGIMTPFIKRNEFLLIDPLNANELIKSLADEINDFETEVDAVLSEINAITTIEI